MNDLRTELKCMGPSGVLVWVRGACAIHPTGLHREKVIIRTNRILTRVPCPSVGWKQQNTLVRGASRSWVLPAGLPDGQAGPGPHLALHAVSMEQRLHLVYSQHLALGTPNRSSTSALHWDCAWSPHVTFVLIISQDHSSSRGGRVEP